VFLTSCAFGLLVATSFWLSFRVRATTNLFRRPLVSQIEEPTDSTRNPERSRLMIVLRASDCGGLAALKAAQRVADSVSAGPHVYGLVVGAPVDSEATRSLLGLRNTLGVRYLRPSDPILSQLASLGHVSTPVALLFDRSGRLRLILPPEEMTPDAFSKVAAIVERDASEVTARPSLVTDHR